MKKRKVSVIVPCYNSEDTLSDQLDALNNQTYNSEWELIIADNGSKDDTLQIAENYSKRGLFNLRIIDASDVKGAGYARNRGVEHAEGDFILFCDSDDVVSETWIEEMVNALEKNELAAPGFDHDKLNDERFSKINNFQKAGLINNKFNPPIPHAGASGLGVRKEIHKKIGGFDESFLAAQDWDYCWKAQLAGYKLEFIPSAVVYIRHRGTLKSWVKQAYTWGIYYALIVKKYKPLGIAPPHLNEVAIKWKKVIINLNRIRNEQYRAKLLWEIFHTLGKIRGSIKFKTFTL